MNDKELYTNILGITAPWKIETVKLDLEVKTVTVFVEFDCFQKVRCPICNEKATIYDHTIRRWRHLDTCQMTTIIECDVPRISCCNHKIKQMPVPWAESASHFTALFEALAINWMLETSISGTAELLRLTWDETAGIKDRAVERGLLKRKDQPMKHIAIDETSFQKRHEYVTIIQDKNNGVVIDVLNDRKSETLEEWLKNRPKEHKESILSVSMDMWDPYIKAIMNEIPRAREVVCFDRFHISQHLGKALDKVRAKENRELLYNTGESILKGTKFKWLTNSDRTDNRSRREFLTLTRMALKTARAWVIKEIASRSWDFAYRSIAEKAWNHLLRRISRCRLKPMIKVGRMLKRYLWGIINAIMARVSNAAAESMNARIQWIKKKACGYRSRNRFRRDILFHLGGLNLMPETLGVRA